MTDEDGFIAIDNARVVLRHNPAGSSPAIEAMVATLRDAFCPLAGIGTIARTAVRDEISEPDIRVSRSIGHNGLRNRRSTPTFLPNLKHSFA